MPEGIEVRHRRGCAALTGARCRCTPSYRAVVWSSVEGKKVARSFPTLAAARSWRADAQKQAQRGVRLGGTGRTLPEAATDLLEGMQSGRIRSRTGDVYKPSVVRGYEQALRLHLLPHFGATKLTKIQRRDVQALVDTMLERGADASTIRNALKPLQVIYRRAIEDDELGASPCERLRLPAARGRRERIATPTEAAALINALTADRALWGMAFYAGVRLGELRAMRWEQVRLAEGVVRIDRSLDATGQVIEPKSRAGNRTVPVVNRLRDLLVEHRVACSGGGFVFGRSPDQPFAPNVVLRRAYAAWRRAGLDVIGLHDARHTYASLLIAAGVNAKAVSAYMGHGSIQVTFDRYGHLMPGSEAEAATMLEAYLDRSDTAARLAQIDP